MFCLNSRICYKKYPGKEGHMYIEVFGFTVRRSDLLALSLSMICTGVSIILVLVGILDPPGHEFWVVLTSVVALVISYRLWGKNGAFSVAAFFVVAGVFYAGYLFVTGVMDWADEVQQKLQKGDYEVQLTRIVFATFVVFIQVVVLSFFLAKASDQKSTPFGVLKSYLVVVMLAGLAIAFAPLPWGIPYLIWGGGVSLTSVVRVRKVVGLTTNYFKPKSDGNRTIAVHDRDAISGSLGDLIWGHGFAFIVASVSVIWFAWIW